MVRAGYFPGVQALRAAAALLVVLQHSIFYACQAAGIDYAPYLKASYGQTGVMLFFCISGFVIGLNRHMAPGRFAIRRALRIYPAFWISCAITLVLLPNARLDWWSAFLLPSTTLNNTLNIPYWTLIFEIAFYALFAAALCFKPEDRTLSLCAVAWIGIVQVMNQYFPVELPEKTIAPGWLVLVSPHTQLFAFGLIVSLHLKRLYTIPAHALLGGAAVSMLVVTTVHMTPAGSSLFYGIAAACIVLLAARAQRVPDLAAGLGNASYGIYLLHLPVLVVLVDEFRGSPLAASPFALWLVMTGIALIVSTVFGFGEHLLHRIVSAAAKASAAAGPARMPEPDPQHRSPPP